jgi:hypothetical protein
MTAPGRPRRNDASDAGAVRLQLVPVSFKHACGFIVMHHRTHRPPAGCKFVVGVARDDVLCGVLIAGRPIARHFDDGRTLEVTRSATDGTPNANSMLYSAAQRACFALGYRRLVTYTQQGESGASLRGAGWRVVAHRPPRPGWTCPSRPREEHGSGAIARTLWEAAPPP